MPCPGPVYDGGGTAEKKHKRGNDRRAHKLMYWPCQTYWIELLVVPELLV